MKAAPWLGRFRLGLNGDALVHRFLEVAFKGAGFDILADSHGRLKEVGKAQGRREIDQVA